MNKYQETLDNLIEIACPIGKCCRKCDMNKNCEAKNYIDTLQELVDKATPKKIEIWNGLYSCPNCKKLFFPITTSIGLPKKICDGCGQALDWSEQKINEQQKLYTWNFDRDEEWNNETFETIEECINDAKNDCDYHGQIIFIGEKKDFEIVVDAGEILTELQNQAFYSVGETSDGWLDNLSENDVDELSDVLSKQVRGWLEEHNELPWFYHVDNIKEY